MTSKNSMSASGLGGLALGAAIILFAVPAAAQSPCGPTTTVQAGDTYFAIAQRCDVSVSFIEQANPGVDPRDLAVGQTLQLTADTGGTEPMPADRYQVQSGDTLFTIAQIMGITVEALMAANPDIDPNALNIGQWILPPHYGVPGGPSNGTQVSGILTSEGVECQALRGHDGQLYTLVGDLGGHTDGGLVHVRGEVQEVSVCQQGVTIEVDDIRSAG